MFVYYKCYIFIEPTFLKETMFIKQVHQKSVIFVTMVFLNKGFEFQPNVCDRCHDLLMMSMNLSDVAILNFKSSDFCCIILISKNKTINLM